MTTYSLTVQIDDVVLRQRSSDKLAIARKVNGSLSAVFDAHRQGSSIQFEWSDKYRVFLAYGDRNGVRVDAATDGVDILAGSLTTFADNQLENPEPKGSGYFRNPGSFGIARVPSHLHAAVQMQVGGGERWATIYIDRNAHMGMMDITIEPQNEYYLFWRGQAETDTIYDLNERDGHKIFFAGDTSKKIRFGYAQSNSPRAGEAPAFH